MFSNFDFQVIIDALPYLFLEGMVFTLKLTLLAALFGTILGTILALMRLSGVWPLPQIAGTYVNFVRSLPLLLVIFWFFFLVPFIAQKIVGSPRPIPIDPFLTALITFSLFEAAYFSEIMRAGIQSLPKGQVAAGYALGLSYPQVMRRIVLPQAFRNMLPVLLTQTIVLFQDTSLVYVLSLNDFLGIAGKIGQRDGRLTEMYLFVALVYFLISFAASQAVRRLQVHTAIIR
ncbi:ABC transporter permease subunit [Rhodomicrobium sp. Az07]|uniref:amino acid ABC transporter permease n=1 Tax=Rhodomicrobium sp. Az07 TaxID=2839034 RepID=UPI001BE5BC3C|nr:ABC transporter permease subunit [Rhodomicrobium sp. Az07]MBT3071633.1 ABC transporter permease subunit [Rhodomicrobium sp. Az07]